HWHPAPRPLAFSLWPTEGHERDGVEQRLSEERGSHPRSTSTNPRDHWGERQAGVEECDATEETPHVSPNTKRRASRSDIRSANSRHHPGVGRCPRTRECLTSFTDRRIQ